MEFTVQQQQQQQQHVQQQQQQQQLSCIARPLLYLSHAN